MDKGKGVAYFQDQLLEIKVTKTNKNLINYELFASKIYSTILLKCEFLRALVDGAEYFFQILIKYYSNCKLGLGRIKKIISKLN